MYWIISIIGICLVFNLFIGNFVYAMPNVVQKSEIGKHYESFGKVLHSGEGFSRVYMDQNGFNNDQGADSDIDILVLGDSFTEALQVDRKENFCSALMGGTTYRVYNTGISGNSMAEYIFYGAAFLDKFNPERVVIQVTSNDFTTDAIGKTKNCYITDENGQPEVVQSEGKTAGLKALKDKVVAFSPLTAYAYIKLKSLIDRTLASDRPFLPSKAAVDETAADSDYTKYESLIQWEISKAKEIYGDKAVFLYIANTPRIENGQVVFTEPEEDNWIKEKVMQYAAEYGIDVIDTTKCFNSEYQHTGNFVRGFNNSKPAQGHLNKVGNRVVGEELKKYFD